VNTLALGERHRVDEADRAALGHEERLVDQGAGEVAPRYVEPVDWADLPVAGGRIEQACTERAAVEARQAKPVNRAATVDQGGRVAVRQEPIGPNRLKMRLPILLFADRTHPVAPSVSSSRYLSEQHLIQQSSGALIGHRSSRFRQVKGPAACFAGCQPALVYTTLGSPHTEETRN
jgi:hypothetical protein